MEGSKRTLVWEFSQAGGGASCTQHDDAGVEHGWNVYRSLVPIPAGNIDLVISSHGEGCVSDALVERVALLGFHLRDEHPPAPSDDPVLRVLALDQAGRREAAQRALAMALRGDDGLADRLLLLAPDRFAPLLREVLGIHYFETFARAFELLAIQHPDEDSVISASLRWLDGA